MRAYIAQEIAYCLTDITWTNADLPSVRSSFIHLRKAYRKISQPLIAKTSLKIIYLKSHSNHPWSSALTNWIRVTHICVGKITTIGSDNGLSPWRYQAIIWTNAEILLIGPLRTNLSKILIGIQTFSFTKMHLKMWSAKWRPFCLGLNVLRNLSMCFAGIRSVGFHYEIVSAIIRQFWKCNLSHTDSSHCYTAEVPSCWQPPPTLLWMSIIVLYRRRCR